MRIETMTEEYEQKVEKEVHSVMHYMEIDELGKKPNERLIRLGRKKASANEIGAFRLSNGKIITKQMYLIEAERSFYEKLHTSNPQVKGVFKTNKRKRNRETKIESAFLTGQEKGKALKELHNSKSPGADVFPKSSTQPSGAI